MYYTCTCTYIRTCIQDPPLYIPTSCIFLHKQCDVQDQRKSLTQQQCTSGSRPIHLMGENNEDVVEGGENQAEIREAGKMMEKKLLTEKEDSADNACTNFVKQV